MFPYVRRELERFLVSAIDTEAVQEAANQIAIDGGHPSLAALVDASTVDSQSDSSENVSPAVRAITLEVIRQMDADLKATGLKQLQGLIWKDGFESGEMQAHLYPDVHPALKQWFNSGLTLRIYSSGSVAAQLLFFGHTTEGDLLSMFDGHDDTKTGPKKVAESYRSIAEKFGLPPEKVLFISDSLDELDAAATAGMQTCWSCRPENPPAERESAHPAIHSFSEIEVTKG